MAYLDDLANRLRIPYRRSRVPEGRRAYLMGGMVVLDEDLKEERANWAYCHEVAHLKLGHPHYTPLDTAEEIEQENEANRLASELMLPEESFRAEIGETLNRLKEVFPFASFEVLARRRLMFRPGLLTIIDNGKTTVRLAPEGWNRPAQWFPVELQAYQQALETKEEVISGGGELTVEATYVDEGTGVVRVILFAEGGEY